MSQEILQRFVRRLLIRKRSLDTCGKLVTRYEKTERCNGYTSNGRCYSCDYTGYDCQNDCGNDVPEGQQFCSKGCSLQYYYC